MEIFRQMLEKDRSKKLQFKEEKQKKASSIISMEEQIITTNINNTPKPEVIKLNSAHQKTLEDLFKEKPEYLKIFGADVESLIIQLGGRIEGKGQGAKLKIFWGNSNALAGGYEVAHEGSSKGYMRSKHAKKVANAIRLGVQRGTSILSLPWNKEKFRFLYYTIHIN